MRIIVIDPGHGGRDSGAASNGIYEKDIALQYGLMLGHWLRAAGFRTLFTRTDNSTLTTIHRQSVVQTGEILVSCHVNGAASRYANGQEVWYRGGVPESKLLASSVYQAINQLGYFKARGVYSDLTRYKTGFYMLRHAALRGCRECILVEPGFITHSGDRATLMTEKKRNLIAKAISDGIQEYLAGR